MILTTQIANDFIELNSTAETVIEPGANLEIRLSIRALQDCVITGFGCESPAVIDTNNETNQENFPLELAKDRESEISIVLSTHPEEEGFGDINSTIMSMTSDGNEAALEWSAWISVFKPASASETDSLSLDLRQRLIDVVNAKDQNGHIFLGDYLAFFTNYLNIQVPERISAILAEEMGLPIEGLPVDEEMLTLLMLGKMTFYGITKLELLPEEECPESDDKFVMSASREVEPERMDDD